MSEVVREDGGQGGSSQWKEPGQCEQGAALQGRASRGRSFPAAPSLPHRCVGQGKGTVDLAFQCQGSLAQEEKRLLH